jgi:hypothetical protein
LALSEHGEGEVAVIKCVLFAAVRRPYSSYSPTEAMAWISLFGLAAVAPALPLSRPYTLADRDE